RDLHRDLAPERRDIHLGAQGRLPDRDRELDVNVVLPALEGRVRRHVDPQVEIPPRPAAGAGAALARRAHPRAVAHARPDRHLHAVGRVQPARPPPRGPRVLPLPPGPPACRPALDLLDPHGATRPGVALLERALASRLEVPPPPPAPAGPEGPRLLDVTA